MGNTINRIVTNEVRFKFINVFTPKATKEGETPKYSITILIPKSDVDTYNKIIAKMNNTLKEAVNTTFNGKMPTTANKPLYDGDGLRPSGEPFGEECKGHWVITASSLQKPQVVDEYINEILNPNEVYSGCYGRVSIRFFAYNKNGNKGVGCGLLNVQKLRDGEPLNGRTTAVEDFGNPVTGYQAPNTGYQAPTGYQTQNTGYQAPNTGYQDVTVEYDPITGEPLTPFF